MKLWTVVLKTVYRYDSLGEFPYEIRALTQEAAIHEAKTLHQTRHPRFNHDLCKVQQVVQWSPLV